MKGILDLLNSDVGQKIVNGVAQEAKKDPQAAQNVLSMAMPVMMQAMRKNAQDPEQAKGLMNAVDTKHDGSILDNLDSFFGGGVDADALTDGSKILGHVLGGKQENVQNVLGAKTGLDSDSISQMLKVAAPIVLGYLGKQKREQNVSDQNGLQSLMGSMLSGNAPQTNESFLNAMLDADGDGSVIDDVADMVLKGNKGGSGGLGNMLGKILGG